MNKAKLKQRVAIIKRLKTKEGRQLSLENKKKKELSEIIKRAKVLKTDIIKLQDARYKGKKVMRSKTYELSKKAGKKIMDYLYNFKV